MQCKIFVKIKYVNTNKMLGTVPELCCLDKQQMLNKNYQFGEPDGPETQWPKTEDHD